jgi:hypothetical protein
LGALSFVNIAKELTTKIEEAYYFYSVRDIKKLPEPVFLQFKEYVEDLKEIVKLAEIDDEIKECLLNYILSIKMGARLPIDFFNKERKLRRFVLANHLDRYFFTTKLILKYDNYGNVYLPFELKKEAVSWLIWKDLRWDKRSTGYAVYHEDKFLFEVDGDLTLFQDYCVLMYGFVKYNAFTSADLRPFRYQDPVNNDYKNYLDVIIVVRNDDKVSYFHRTHVYMELCGADGFVRSFGQDIYDHVHNMPYYGVMRAAQGSGIISTPDITSYNPKHHRLEKRYRLAVTKKEHDQIIALVESDKYNHKRIASLMKGNCVSYTRRLLSKIFNYDVHTDAGAVEMFFRNYGPSWLDDLVVSFASECRRLPSWVRKALFFVPPFYILNLMGALGITVLSIRGFESHREFSTIDYFFRPWRVRLDLPYQIDKTLDKYSDKNGFIDRSNFPEGFVFD